jgi:hypothetical protein
MKADVMSDMKTYTVRDLDRQPGVVLAACDREGEVRIQRRNGRSYRLLAEQAESMPIAWRKLVAAHRARIRTIFPEQLSARQTRLADRLLAGE